MVAVSGGNKNLNIFSSQNDKKKQKKSSLKVSSSGQKQQLFQ